MISIFIVFNTLGTRNVSLLQIQRKTTTFISFIVYSNKLQQSTPSATRKRAHYCAVFVLLDVERGRGTTRQNAIVFQIHKLLMVLFFHHDTTCLTTNVSLQQQDNEGGYGRISKITQETQHWTIS
jgi:hypothetical protein